MHITTLYTDYSLTVFR